MFDEKTLATAKRLHFVGIGGSGMFPIVQILHGRGHTITGSDNNESDTLALERDMGIPVFLSHDAKNIEGADLVIYSAAIMPDNPELAAARERNIPTVERAEMLGYITRQYSDCLCVCGTHGKTTTTAMLTQILMDAGFDPTAVIGGKLKLIGGNGRLGQSQFMTCEACEFKDTFLKLSPDISVILNIDEDHLDYFKTLDNIIRSFRQFAEMTRKTIVVNGDDQNAMQAVVGLDKHVVTFGLAEGNDYFPANIQKNGRAGTTFDLMFRGDTIVKITLNVPGMHNILDAVAACAVAIEAGAKPAALAAPLAGFYGAGRRFEILGEKNGVTIADDYAHHPAELRVTLEVAKSLGYKRVWAVFQPFTYSRTRLLLNDFAAALGIADRVVMSEIMGGRETNEWNIFTSDLAALVPGSVWFGGADEFRQMADYVMANAGPGDLVLTMGCGDVYKCAKLMLE